MKIPTLSEARKMLEDEGKWVNYNIGVPGAEPEIIDLKAAISDEVDHKYLSYFDKVRNSLISYLNRGKYPIIALVLPKDLKNGELFLALDNAELKEKAEQSDSCADPPRLAMKTMKDDTRYRVVIADMIDVNDLNAWIAMERQPFYDQDSPRVYAQYSNFVTMTATSVKVHPIPVPGVPQGLPSREDLLNPKNF